MAFSTNNQAIATTQKALKQHHATQSGEIIIYLKQQIVKLNGDC